MPNKLLKQVSSSFEGGCITNPLLGLSYVLDKNLGTIGVLDWDRKEFTLNTDYKYYKQSKAKMIESDTHHSEQKIKSWREVYTEEDHAELLYGD